MCGIVAFAGPDPVDLAPALAALRHRGPDGRGARSFRAGEGWAGLGAVRLAIQDLSPAGLQPLASEDGQTWLVCNGELYDAPALRRELSALGHRFTSGSDAEVALHAYRAHGDAFLHRLRGMFALVLWDGRRQRLLAARDRLGVKPLFWSEHGGRLLLGSEQKALLALGVPRDPDPDALGAWLRHLHVPPPLTMFRHVHRLPPGHLLTWERGRVEVRRWWRLARPAVARDEATLVRQVRATLEEAVRLHLAADVPVGAFLSGGLDSSSLAALMARAGAGPLRTFCLTFDDEPRQDERGHARRVAEHLGAVHEEVPVGPDLASLLPEVVAAFDEPFGNPTALLVHALSKAARRTVKVAISGDGGDELFLGYPRHPGAALAAGWRRRIPGPLRRGAAALAARLPERAGGAPGWRRAREFLASGDRPLEAMYADWMGWASLDEVALATGRPAPAAAARVEALLAEAPTPRFLDRLVHAELGSFLPDNLLAYGDRMSMAHGLEVRVPFCDHVLVELLAAVPYEMKVRGLTTKVLLRKAMGDLLPPEVLRRPKLGLNPPTARWLAGPLRALVDEQLAPARVARQGLLRPDWVAGLVARHRSGRRDHSVQLWALLALQAWAERYQGAAP